MKKTAAFLVAVATILAMPSPSLAGPWARLDQNISLPTQEVFEHKTWSIPLGSSASYYKLNVSIPTGTPVPVTSFLNSGAADFPRNVTLSVTGTTQSSQAGTAVVSGLNIYGKAISESFTVSNNQSAILTGNKAFKSLTQVVFPVASASGLTLSIGLGNSLGIIHCLDHAGEYAFSEIDGVYETTRGTMQFNATLPELNTFQPNGTMNGAKNVDLFYIQNFRCFSQ